MPINVVYNTSKGTDTAVRGNPTSLTFAATNVRNGNREQQNDSCPEYLKIAAVLSVRVMNKIEFYFFEEEHSKYLFG
jgi:hypothetical protein